MRVIERVRNFIKDPLNRDKITFLMQKRGGWERWFQLELAYWIARDFKQYKVELETHDYVNGALRTDILLTKTTSSSEYKTVVELKCEQANADSNRFVQSVFNDIEKAQQLLPSITAFTAVALIQNPHTMEVADQMLTTLIEQRPALISFNYEGFALPGLLYYSIVW